MEVNRLQELDEQWYLGGDDWYAAAFVVVAFVAAGDQCVAVAFVAARIREIGILYLVVTDHSHLPFLSLLIIANFETLSLFSN